jgi:hypothetical protein
LKYFLDLAPARRIRLAALAIFIAAVGASVSAFGELPSWIRNIDASTALEAVFFRMMSLPSGAVAYRRPPRETGPALGELIKSQPRNADLYSLRALEDEQQLDFVAAEADWKSYAANAADPVEAATRPGGFLSPPPAAHGRNRRAVHLIANAPSGCSFRKIAPLRPKSAPGTLSSASSA